MVFRAIAALLLLAAPVAAQAFSFGTFSPGEKILSIELSGASGGGTAISFDHSTGALTYSAPVSTITTNLTTYNIALGSVLFDSQVMLTSETVIAPFPPFFGGQILASFSNGFAADLTLTDLGVGGSGLLLAANYSATLDFQANPQAVGFPVAGRLDAGFSVIGGAGDPSFEAAFGSGGSYFALLANFTSNGTPVGNDLCNLITPFCASGQSLDSFTVNPTATLTPTVPEPASLVLLVLAAAALVKRGRSD